MNRREEDCIICGKPEIEIVDFFRSFCRVASDNKPMIPGGAIGACNSCGTVQKIPNQEWQDECEKIYEGYRIYDQSGGSEQRVFVNDGNGCSRSAVIVSNLLETLALPATGRLLDVGCGNGAFLKAFGAILPSWGLSGAEINNKYEEEVRRIPSVEEFFADGVDRIQSSFEIISLIHVLEHVTTPQALIENLLGKLTETGKILIEVPNFLENPFDLLIADHIVHYTPASIKALHRGLKSKTKLATFKWLHKETTAIFSKGAKQNYDTTKMLTDTAGEKGSPSIVLKSTLAWLDQVRATALKIRNSAQVFGLFGSSNAASWLYQELNGQVDFFVDEDQNRMGHSWLGKEILSPENAPNGSVVFLPIAPNLRDSIRKRLSILNPNINFT